MTDIILIDGDKVNFDSLFAPAVVKVQAGNISASGPPTLGGKKVCVEGDEGSVSVAGCDYVSPPFAIPGKGTMKIKKLAPDQLAVKTTAGGKKVLLKGMKFIAEFKVDKPAEFQTPSGPQTDPMPQYVGTGSFKSSNQKLKGT